MTPPTSRQLWDRAHRVQMRQYALMGRMYAREIHEKTCNPGEFARLCELAASYFSNAITMRKISQ